MHPLISIIIPFYNMESFLAEAVESVLIQDYTNWEMLLVDDGSSDGSTEIAKRYARKHPSQINYLMHEDHRNKGLTASRNLGLHFVLGEYVALLDADDCWLPEKLSTQVKIAAAYPDCALIGGASLYWNSWADASKADIMVKVGCPEDQLIFPPQLSYQLYPLGKGAAPCPCSLLIKTAILKKHKGFEDQFTGIYQMYEDQAFLAKLYLNESCFMSARCLDKYRQRPQSLVGSIHQSGQYRQVRKFFLEWLRDYLESHQLREEKIRKILTAALAEYENPGSIPPLPFVTVLMPVYNGGKFLEAAIESILGQTFQSFELLIIDDCSTDHSISVIESFRDPRIRLVKNERNEGITPCLNKGIALAKYELIARMDADDVCHPWRLEKQSAYMQAHPCCGMLSSWVRIIDEEGRYIRTEGTDSKYLYYNLFFECCIYHPTVMFRKKMLQEIGGYQSDYAEDFDLFWRMGRHFKISGMNEPLLDYRIHPANTNTVARKEEYEKAGVAILRRNLRFCVNDDAEIPLSWLDGYRYRFTGLKEKRDLSEIQDCISLLDRISLAIMTISGPNNKAEDIRYMWQFKKKYILKALSASLPLSLKLRMLCRYDKKEGVFLPILKNDN